MSGPHPASADAKELCRKFPDHPTLTLAKMLYKEHSLSFRDLEAARGLVRMYRGEKGKESRKNVQKSIVPTGKHQRKLPDSKYKPIEPYIFKQKGRGAVMSDLHVPYHDAAALDCALDFVTARGHTDFCILNGDIIDCHSISRFLTDPREKDFAGELEATKELLATLTSIFDKVYLKGGNHEVRYEHFMWHKAPELLGIATFELSALLGLEQLGIDWIADNRIIHVGALCVVHGHEWGKNIFNPVNAARGLFLRGKTSMLCGHHHSTSEHTESDARGKVIASWGVGCLCGLQPKYAPLGHTRWNHGFALLNTDGQDYEVENKRIVKGKVR